MPLWHVLCLSRGMKTYRYAMVVFCVGIFCLSGGWVYAQKVGELPATMVSTNKPWKPGSGKLKDLQQKANERDEMAKQVLLMKQELDRLQSQVRSENAWANNFAVRSKPGRLKSLEIKAAKYELLYGELKISSNTIDSLKHALVEEKSAKSECQEEVLRLRSQVKDLMAANTELEMMERVLQDRVDQLLLGNFEYYEVRTGDTLSSIAESPLVYGDAAKAEWIRQANSRRVDNLDNLHQGEMLIIPRFPPSGRYEF